MIGLNTVNYELLQRPIGMLHVISINQSHFTLRLGFSLKHHKIFNITFIQGTNYLKKVLACYIVLYKRQRKALIFFIHS